MTQHTLTDDEIAAASLQLEQPWRGTLPTVADTAEALGAAAARGRRSLVVRGLVEQTASGIPSDLAGVLAQVSTASRVTVAYTTSSDTLDVLRGTATYVFAAEDGAIIDFVAPEGVHDLRVTDVAEASAIVVALAENVFRFGVRTGAEDARLVIVTGSGPDGLVVGRGTFAVLHVDGSTIAASPDSSDFDADAIHALFK